MFRRWKIVSFIIGLSLLGSLMQGCGEDSRVLTTIVVSPSPATIAVSGTLQFFAATYDQFGVVLPADVTWAASSAIGIINTSGLLTGVSTTASGSVTATAQGVVGTSSVTITDKGTVSGRLTNSSGNAVESMKVYINGLPTLMDFSDSSGDYSIANIPSGLQEVITGENALYITTSAEVTVVIAATTAANIILTDRLAVENENISGDPMTISGRVRNNGTSEAQGVEIVYIFYDETGTLLSSASGNLADIAAGATQIFYLSPTPPIEEYASKERTVSATSY